MTPFTPKDNDTLHLSSATPVVSTPVSSTIPVTPLPVTPLPMTLSEPPLLTHSLSIPCSESKRESYKDRRKTYRKEKKKVAEELMSNLSDPTVVVMADWLKVRGTLKGWTKLWCELKPGILSLYRSNKTHKTGQWVGTVLLSVCEVIERPSKKNGFCFKLFHPLEHPIWAPKGPHGESFGSIMLPLPVSYIIFRAPSDFAGRNWMEGIVCSIELSSGCTSLLRHHSTRESNPNNSGTGENGLNIGLSRDTSNENVFTPPSTTGIVLTLNESEMEKHFKDHDLDDDFQTDHNDSQRSDSDSDHYHHKTNGHCSSDAASDDISETSYTHDGVIEEFGIAGDAGQTEEVADENRGLIWSLLKQVRPGMDLSRVVLPTFILEPRSFLEKISDYYFHCDIISNAVLEDDPLDRMKMIVKWYLSGFYKKPKGLKKPYNPILGETFRCYWSHPDTNSRTFYISEQVSHHPPVSAFYITNRKDGFCIRGSILAKSKFYGNSISALLEGTARLSLLSRGEDYTLTMPYAHCKGILLGTLSLELGGKVEINCEKTGYRTELEFKLKPFLGSSDLCNLINGKIRLGKETLAIVEGHWDDEIIYRDKRTGDESVLWSPTPEIRLKRLKRFTVPMQNQEDFESEKLWRYVTIAIINGDQIAATEQKTILEEEQRRAVKERLLIREKFVPKLFVETHNDWVYKYDDTRPWDTRTDVLQYERDYIIQTKTRHKTSTVIPPSGSILSVDTKADVLRRVGSLERTQTDTVGPSSSASYKHYHRTASCASEESSSVVDCRDSTESDGKSSSKKRRNEKLNLLLEPIQELQQETNTTLKAIQKNLNSVIDRQNQLQRQMVYYRERIGRGHMNDFTLIMIIVLAQIVLNWIFKKWQ